MEENVTKHFPPLNHPDELWISGTTTVSYLPNTIREKRKRPWPKNVSKSDYKWIRNLFWNTVLMRSYILDLLVSHHLLFSHRHKTRSQLFNQPKGINTEKLISFLNRLHNL